jgi:[NiFe] hydrogenase assembly HybE family chaperone
MALAEPSAQVVPDCTERAGASTIAPEPADQALRNRARTLTRAFEAAFKELHAGKMREVPLLNKALYVQAIGFQPYESKILGVLLTPWFMNLVIIPDASFDAAKPGTKELINFPSGNYEFIWAARPETGPYMACSLFSPVHELTNQLMAVEVAQAVLIAIFDPENRVEGAKTAEIRAARDQEIAASNAAEAPGDGHSALDAIPSRRAILTGRLEPAELKP